MAKRRALTTIVAEDLTQKVMSGTLEPGSRLPTESELCENYDVSRTVIREAVARLRSDGLLVSYQGRGMFVVERLPNQKFEIDENQLNTLPETISLLELRLSVEVESAGLCATECTPAEARDIRALMEGIDAHSIDPSSIGVHYDFHFHLAISKATHNPFFFRFLKFLEPIIVPRFRLSVLVTKDLRTAYYDRIHAEHEAIVRAIENRDPVAARDSMRVHLTNSLERLRALSQASGIASDSVSGDPRQERLLDSILEDTFSTAPD